MEITTFDLSVLDLDHNHTHQCVHIFKPNLSEFLRCFITFEETWSQYDTIELMRRSRRSSRRVKGKNCSPTRKFIDTTLGWSWGGVRILSGRGQNKYRCLLHNNYDRRSTFSLETYYHSDNATPPLVLNSRNCFPMS